ncbi:MAG: hypothetical protein AAF739_07135 [Pseudomonadota bacterium]
MERHDLKSPLSNGIAGERNDEAVGHQTITRVRMHASLAGSPLEDAQMLTVPLRA